MVKRGSQDREIRDALRALLSDIEGMYEGPQVIAEHAQPEELFGPFSFGKLGSSEIAADISVSWPNLAISMRNAKAVLLDLDVEQSGTSTA